MFFFYKASNQTESLRTAQIHQSSDNYQVPGPKLSQILTENISSSFCMAQIHIFMTPLFRNNGSISPEDFAHNQTEAHTTPEADPRQIKVSA